MNQNVVNLRGERSLGVECHLCQAIALDFCNDSFHREKFMYLECGLFGYRAGVSINPDNLGSTVEIWIYLYSKFFQYDLYYLTSILLFCLC